MIPAPSVASECICGHPQLAHEDDVGFCWDCDACAADPACREFVERVLKDGPVALDGGVCDCETPGDWHRVANDFQRAMFREAAKAKAYRAALEELRKAGGALYPAASEVENAGDFDVAPLGCSIGWLKALEQNWVVAVRHDAWSKSKTWRHGGSREVLEFVRQRERDWRWWDNPEIQRPLVSLVAHDRGLWPRGTTRLIRTGTAAMTAMQQATLPISTSRRIACRSGRLTR